MLTGRNILLLNFLLTLPFSQSSIDFHALSAIGQIHLQRQFTTYIQPSLIPDRLLNGIKKTQTDLSKKGFHELMTSHYFDLWFDIITQLPFSFG